MIAQKVRGNSKRHNIGLKLLLIAVTSQKHKIKIG